MELGIFTNKCRKKFAGICRDQFCNGKNGVQYKFPYLIRDRKLQCFCGDFSEDTSDGFIRLEPLHRAQYIVLHHRKCETGNLCGKVNRLTFAKIEQALHIVIGDLGGPSHGVSPVSFKETEILIRCEKPVSLSLTATLTEEKSDGRTSEFGVNGAISASEGGVVLTKFLHLKFSDNLFGGKIPVFGLVSGLADFDHTEKVTFDMTAGNQPNEIGVCEPTVHEKIVEADAFADGIFDHLYSLVCFLHQVFVDSFLDSLLVMVFTETGISLRLRKSLLLIWLLTFLTMEGKVKHKLAYTVRKQQGKALEAKYALVAHMGVYTADELTLLPCLRSIRVIDNQAYRLVVLTLRLTFDLLYQLPIHRIEQLTPFDVSIIHKTIKLNRSSCWPGGTKGQYEDQVVRVERCCLSMGINLKFGYHPMPS